MSEGLPVLASFEELLAGATDAAPLDGSGKSGARIDRVRFADEVRVVKYLDDEDDWIPGVVGGARHRGRAAAWMRTPG